MSRTVVDSSASIPLVRSGRQSDSSTPTVGIRGWLTRLRTLGFQNSAADLTVPKVPRGDLAYMLRNIATLVSSGISLKKALATLARERSLRKHAPMLRAIRRQIENGESFSTALSTYPQTFTEIILCQIRVGEASGTVAETLRRIAMHLENANQWRARIVKRLSYPAIVLLSGGLVVLFLLIYVLPQFQVTYEQARVPLPLSTSILIHAGEFAVQYGWLFAIAMALLFLVLYRARQNPVFSLKMDGWLLRIPVLGDWIRDIAVLQFMDVMAVMMQSGFKIVDALEFSSSAISNRAVRLAVEGLRSAVLRGERLSRELDRCNQLFPPVVSQLVIVGEQTGSMSKSTIEVREHLRRQIERKAELFVGAIEPVLTIAMAVAIGAILLAIYLPMFSMVDVVDATGP